MGESGVNVDLEHLSQQRVMESLSSIVGYIRRKRELIVSQLSDMNTTTVNNNSP